MIVPLVAALALLGCAADGASEAAPDEAAASPAQPAALADSLERAIFAGGCFWCMEPPYDKLDGVAKTISGFAGGSVPNPTYKQVVRGGTGHYEAVRIEYDPAEVKASFQPDALGNLLTEQLLRRE